MIVPMEIVCFGPTVAANAEGGLKIGVNVEQLLERTSEESLRSLVQYKSNNLKKDIFLGTSLSNNASDTYACLGNIFSVGSQTTGCTNLKGWN